MKPRDERPGFFCARDSLGNNRGVIPAPLDQGQNENRDASSGPVAALPAANERVHVYDVLRGLAILGTFASNIWVFAYGAESFEKYFSAVERGKVPFVELMIGRVSSFLANGKFLAMLSIMFGVGVELLYRRAVNRGDRWPGRYWRRCVILFLIGLLHYIFVFEYDVLMGYAVTAVVVAYLLPRSDRTRIIWVCVCGTVHVLTAVAFSLVYGFFYNKLQEAAGGAEAVADRYFAHVVDRLSNILLYRLETFGIVPMTIVLFLIGAQFARWGVLSIPSAKPEMRRLLCRVGLGFGVPLNALVFVPVGAGGMAAIDMLVRYIFAPVLTLGIMAFVSIRLEARRAAKLAEAGASVPGTSVPGAVGTPRGEKESELWAGVAAALSNVGRSALTCYIGQNVLGVLVFAPYALGLQDQLPAIALPFVLVTIWVVLLFVARACVRRWGTGPIEVLWRKALGGRGATTAAG